MSDEQKAALTRLLEALTVATDTGLLDEVWAHCIDPDSINDVCDAAHDLQVSQ